MFTPFLTKASRTHQVYCIVIFTFLLTIIILLFNHTLSLASENSECMECHSDESLTREETNNIILSRMSEVLFLEEDKFNHSVHHTNDVSCIDCHEDIEELDYDDDLPHKSHLNPVNCSKCHEEESEAFTQSVHMKIRGKGITMQCYACHGYHYVKHLGGYSVAERENTFCLKCHNPYQYHDWLPQKKAHFDFVECTVCHAPTVPQHIHLKFFDLVSNKFLTANEILETLDIKLDHFLTTIDTNQDTIINKGEFDDLILILRQKNIHTITHAELVAELKPIVHNVTRGGAVKDCEQCHSANSPLFNAVTIVLARDDGTVDHFEVDRTVLESYSMSHFSALAGTRVKFVDKIGIFTLAGAGCAASGHFVLRIFTIPIRRRKKNGTGHK